MKTGMHEHDANSSDSDSDARAVRKYDQESISMRLAMKTSSSSSSVPMRIDKLQGQYDEASYESQIDYAKTLDFLSNGNVVYFEEVEESGRCYGVTQSLDTLRSSLSFSLQKKKISSQGNTILQQKCILQIVKKASLTLCHKLVLQFIKYRYACFTRLPLSIWKIDIFMCIPLLERLVRL